LYIKVGELSTSVADCRFPNDLFPHYGRKNNDLLLRPHGRLESRGTPFRPRRALRALADGYANGALRALPLARLHFTTPVVINKIGTLTSFETPHFATKSVSISVLRPPE
jgi:hypothetical protein